MDSTGFSSVLMYQCQVDVFLLASRSLPSDPNPSLQGSQHTGGTGVGKTHEKDEISSKTRETIPKGPQKDMRTSSKTWEKIRMVQVVGQEY